MLAVPSPSQARDVASASWKKDRMGPRRRRATMLQLIFSSMMVFFSTRVCYVFTFSLYSNPFSHGNRVGSDYNIMFLFNLILII